MSVDAVRAAVTATREGTARFTHAHRVDLAPMRATARRAMARSRQPRDDTLRGDLAAARRELWHAGLRTIGRRFFEASGGSVEAVGTGVVDFPGRRYVERSPTGAHRVGPEGVCEAVGDNWAPPAPERPSAHNSVLWLVDVLAGATTADERPGETVRGTACRVLDVRCDLSLAEPATPGRLPTPAVPRFDDLLAFGVRVRVGDGTVRRVVHVVHVDATETRTLELFDHGVAIDDAVWARPPACPDP